VEKGDDETIGVSRIGVSRGSPGRPARLPV